MGGFLSSGEVFFFLNDRAMKTLFHLGWPRLHSCSGESPAGMRVALEQVSYGQMGVQVGPLELCPGSLSCHCEKEGASSCKKEAAGPVCARFVCHISACLRLMQMGRGAGRDGSMGNCWC